METLSVDLNRETGLRLLSRMVLIRRFEEKSAEMYTKEKIRGFLHLYVGEEATAVGVIDCLSNEDPIFSTYREHAHALVRGVDSSKIMAEMFGKQEGCCKGRGGSMHLFDVEKFFYGGNAIVAGHLPLSVGMALALKKQKKSNVVTCFFGEGAMAEGEFHEAMNLAALWQVPILMVCENNLYAMGTAVKLSHANLDFVQKGLSYGIESVFVDGMDVWAVKQATQKALDYMKTFGKPYFLITNTYRYRAHSMFDAELYRAKSEVADWKKKDPITHFKNHLIEHKIISEVDFQNIEIDVENEIQQAVDYAENGTLETISDLEKFIYSE
jgi:pyruvate dehydrogenase E1 component alpha subunit